MTDGLSLRVQRLVLACAGVLILLIGTVPPWVIITPAVTLGNINIPERVKPIGYALFFRPPDPERPEFAGDALNEYLPNEDAEPANRNQNRSSWGRALDSERNDRSAKRFRMVRVDFGRLSLHMTTVVTAAGLLALSLRKVKSITG